MAALPLALTLDRFTNGLTRPFFGWVSDRIGRENTMLLAFGFEGVAMTLWLLNRDNAVLFVLLIRRRLLRLGRDLLAVPLHA
jgi:OFA family oxalate/formate antiporter-like MFS transporter